MDIDNSIVEPEVLVEEESVQKKPKKEKIVAGAEPVQKNDETAGTYTVTYHNGVNIRDEAGMKKPILAVAPHNARVRSDGSFTLIGGIKWVYATYKTSQADYTGFINNKFIKKK